MYSGRAVVIGSNGSGKTVLFKTMIGYLKPTGGRVVVGEKELGKDIDFADNMGIIIENPEILILDEPMNGLDNQGVDDVRNLLLKLKEEGKTVILASHNKKDIEILCDEVYEMDHGKLI